MQGIIRLNKRMVWISRIGEGCIRVHGAMCGVELAEIILVTRTIKMDCIV